MTAAGIARGTGQVLLGLVIWPFLLPLGIRRLCRVARRLVRKLAKPALLWLNAWRFKRSESEIDRLRALRDDAARAEGIEHLHQVKLQQQRRTIGGW